MGQQEGREQLEIKGQRGDDETQQPLGSEDHESFGDETFLSVPLGKVLFGLMGGELIGQGRLRGWD